MAWRRYSSVRGRRLRPDEVALETFAMSPVGQWLLLNVSPWVDKRIIPLTNGAFSSTGYKKVGILTSLGARSGQRRPQPLTMVQDGRDLIVVGSNYGHARHPSWSANLLANSSCEVIFRGAERTYRAALLSGTARALAWEKVVDFHLGYAVYADKCAPREIRVFALSPA
jgi:deazaflavin-dependent oxidoreductase (nitroreductase family)